MQKVKSAFKHGIRLIPVLPSKNRKYEGPVERSDQTVLLAIPPPASESWTIIDDRAELPSGWEEHVTPEGDTYWSNNEKKIVSHADPGKPVVANLIESAYEDIRGKVRDWSNSEVFFNTVSDVPETPVSGTLEYYVLDHPAKQVVWAEEVKPQQLGMGEVTSRRHLASALLSEYWTHYDYFPCHRAIDDESANELKDILRHGAIDDLTAPGSTFPYSAEECRQYLSFLDGFGETHSSPGRAATKTAAFARVWATLARVRHINNFGLKNARLDRLQGVENYIKTHNRPSFRLRLAELMTFNTSRRLFNRMTELWNGRIVYQRHWHVLFDELCNEWGLTGMINAALLITSVFIIFLRDEPVPLLHASVASTAITSLILGLVLHRIHQRSALATASDISSYISYAESTHFGLRGLSIVLALPRALTIWGAVLLQAAIIMELVPECRGSYWWYKIAALGAEPTSILVSSVAFFRPPH